MIGYVTVGVTDIDKSKAFYADLLKELGATITYDGGRIAFIGKSMADPMIAVCIPYDEEAPHAGNGNMIAITADSKEQVKTLYDRAISLGATCDGEPGQRIPDVFYGAYVRDFDGNKIAFFRFG